jgi:predicted LPLAT superfamily acyltransferase
MGIVGRKKAFLGLPVLLLLPIFFVVFLGRVPIVWGLNYTTYRQVSSLRLERIQRHLDQINKPAVMTIEVYMHFIFFGQSIYFD